MSEAKLIISKITAAVPGGASSGMEGTNLTNLISVFPLSWLLKMKNSLSRLASGWFVCFGALYKHRSATWLTE